MILSILQLFSDGQTVPLSSTDLVSTNVIDLGAPGTVHRAPAALVRDVGPGEPVQIFAEAFSTAGTTLTVKLFQSTAANMATPDTLVTGVGTTIAAGGRTWSTISILPDRITKRYISLAFTTGSGGSAVIDAGITLGRQSALTVPGA